MVLQSGTHAVTVDVFSLGEHGENIFVIYLIGNEMLMVKSV